jgi:uroporphyrinogen decarboxylase
MKPRERVLAAINHEESDRVPIVIGVSNATSIKMEAYQRLKRLIDVEAADRYLYDWPQLGTAAVDEATLQRLGSDVRGVWDRIPQSNRELNANLKSGEPFIDSWGAGQIELAPGEWFPFVNPLAEATSVEEIKNHAWPDMDDPSRVAGVQKEAALLAAENEFAIMATPWLLFPFERAIQMQGMGNFLLNMGANPELAMALLAKTTEACKGLMAHFLRELGDNVDIIKIGDDLGTQESLLISSKMYREYVKPLHADYISFIKERTAAKVFFHTDGDVYPLIEDFIEIGVDILNPIQTSAGQMADLKELKKRFGEDIVFCGAIDTHQILPFGSPADVRQEVRRVIECLGPGGGYMLASVHSIMDDVPPENIVAMVDAVEEFGRFPL